MRTSPPPPPPASPYYGSKASAIQTVCRHRSVPSYMSGDFDELPSPKPPSSFHNFSGDERAQDVFAEVIEKNRRVGDKFKILYPGQDEFEMARLDLWNHDEICTPSLILQPKTTAEVQSCTQGYVSGVRQCLIKNNLEDSKMGIPRLCISSGKHSLSCMKDGSIVLDLCRMKKIQVDVRRGLVTVQGGVRIIDLDHELGKSGLMAVMGMFQNLGVVGCILGGGLGYASRKHGLAADNVVKVKLVLADGRIKECSAEENADLFWSVRGGGGGVGIVTSLVLRCFPLQNAAMVTSNLFAPNVRYRKNVLRQWGNWVGMDSAEDDDTLCFAESGDTGVVKEVFSMLILQANSSSIPCISTSVDPEVIPQSQSHLETFQDVMRKKPARNIRPASKNSFEKKLPVCWSGVPGLTDLRSNKFGAMIRFNSSFKMVRYHSELQGFMDQYWSPGNVFMAYKYAKLITPHVIEVLVESVWGQKSPKNESRIFISSAGKAINTIPQETTPLKRGEINFAIFIEGRWSENASTKEREKVINWVHWTVNRLHACDGIHSTSHPESLRDQVSKSGKSQPLKGWYNFGKKEGERLKAIKEKYDPRNVFSLASRISSTGVNPVVANTRDGDARNDGIVAASDIKFAMKKVTRSTKNQEKSGDGGDAINLTTDRNPQHASTVPARNFSSGAHDPNGMGTFMELFHDAETPKQSHRKEIDSSSEDVDLDEWSLTQITIQTPDPFLFNDDDSNDKDKEQIRKVPVDLSSTFDSLDDLEDLEYSESSRVDAETSNTHIFY